jgi:hypothetical protein
MGSELVKQRLAAGVEVFDFDLLKKNELSYGFKVSDVREPAIADSFPRRSGRHLRLNEVRAVFSISFSSQARCL